VHGKGKIKYKNGDMYEGDFKRGVKEGFGIYRFKQPADRVYTGQFLSDLMTGNGVMEFEDKKMVYQGDFVNGTMQGNGRMVFVNGIIYEGEWLDDTFCGEGTLFLQDDRAIKGTWLECNIVDGDLLKDIETLENTRKTGTQLTKFLEVSSGTKVPISIDDLR
jgi:radial spoke head protein 1